MKITKKIVKIGKSLGIIIDKVFLNKMNVNYGDFVEIEINKIKGEGGK